MIQKLYVDKAVKDHALVGEIEHKLALGPAKVVEGPRELQQIVAQHPDPVAAGKQALLLTRNRGPFIRKCPGTRSYLCCGYQILHIGTCCTMDCSYCILQHYFNPPILQYFVNQEELFGELDALLDSNLPRFRRIGTGEFTDSLIWEPWTGINPKLVRRFGAQDRVVLELKTKTVSIQRFEGLAHNRKTIIAWSLNPQRIISTQERGAASLKARLQAAAQCRKWGYPLAFHFDPIILYAGWEADYQGVVNALFDAVAAEDIVWISLGSLRFHPSLKPIARRRFPRSKIFYAEFVPGVDGKMRYFKPLRIKAYQNMVRWIRRHSSQVGIYLCMEDEAAWQAAFGFLPQDNGGLPAMLDGYARAVCGLQ